MWSINGSANAETSSGSVVTCPGGGEGGEGGKGGGTGGNEGGEGSEGGEEEGDIEEGEVRHCGASKEDDIRYEDEMSQGDAPLNLSSGGKNEEEREQEDEEK